MQYKLQTTFDNMEPTDAIRDYIKEHAAKLGRLSRSITHVRVTASIPHRRAWRAAEYRVGIEVKQPPFKPIVVRAMRSDDLYGCISEAFAAATRLLTSRAKRGRANKRYVRAWMKEADHAYAET